MKRLRAAAALAILAWLSWLTIEMRKLDNVQRELAQHEAGISKLHDDLAREFSHRDASFQTLHDNLNAEVGSLKAQLMALRLARRPVTRADLNSIASRLDILEGNLRSLHSAGQ
jgi:Skp family chaperone for outer membrane proteins